MKKTSGAAGLRDAVEGYLESCARVTVDIDAVERLLRPGNLEVSLKYVLKHEAEDDGWKAREETVHGRRMGKTSGMTLIIKEARQKLCRAPTAPCRLPSFSKARRRLKKKKKKIIGS